jgi:hypothetical protein
MKSQTVANWIQMVTGVAVIIGLGLVVWELRQSRDATLSQLSSEYWHFASQERVAIFGEDAANVLAKACHQPMELTESDLVILEQYYEGLIARIDRMMILRERGGFYGTDQWREAIPILDTLFMSQPGRAYWASVASSWVNPEIYAAGNELLANWNQPMCNETHSVWMQAIKQLSAN